MLHCQCSRSSVRQHRAGNRALRRYHVRPVGAAFPGSFFTLGQAFESSPLPAPDPRTFSLAAVLAGVVRPACCRFDRFFCHRRSHLLLGDRPRCQACVYSLAGHPPPLSREPASGLSYLFHPLIFLCVTARDSVYRDLSGIRIHLQHIFRSIRIMLQRRQTLHQPRTPFMNEQPWCDAHVGLAQPMQNFSPPIHTLRVRAA